MQYWASDVAGMDETIPPLFDFIERLAKSGEGAAKSMYRCQKGTCCNVENKLSQIDQVDFISYCLLNILQFYRSCLNSSLSLSLLALTLTHPLSLTCTETHSHNLTHTLSLSLSRTHTHSPTHSLSLSIRLGGSWFLRRLS